MLMNVFMLIKGLVMKKKMESRLDCINIIADACKIIMLRDKKKRIVEVEVVG